MNLLINSCKLELLLEKNREKIGHNSIQGIDTLFSGFTFFISTMFSSYMNIGPISERLIKISCMILSIAFLIRGIYMICKSVETKYGHDKLLNDIKNLNEITHPFSIIVIKDTFSKYPNKFLLYYDNRWACKLFLNYRTNSGTNSDNEENIRIHLSNELKLPLEKIKIKYCLTRIQKKFSVSDKICKCYEHRVYYVEIPFRPFIKKTEFEIDGKYYYWMTMSEMEQDKEIQSKNLDVVDLVREIAFQ